MEKFYIGECEHLSNCCITDDDCLKRHIHITNPKTNSLECLIFCNDYLKLHSQKESENFFSRKEKVLDFIIKKVIEHIGLEQQWLFFNKGNSIADYRISFYICERPFISCHVTIKHLIAWYFDNPTQLLADLIRQEICNYLDQLKYAKFKTKYKELIHLANKLKHNYGTTNEDKQLIISELINETFKLTIKNQ